jgi:hypothetical protein
MMLINPICADDFKYEKDVCLLKLNAPVLAKTVKLNFVTPTRTKQQVDRNKKPSTVVTAYVLQAAAAHVVDRLPFSIYRFAQSKMHFFPSKINS